MNKIAIASLCNLTFITSTHAFQPGTGAYICGGKVFRSESDDIDITKVQIKAVSNDTDVDFVYKF